MPRWNVSDHDVDGDQEWLHLYGGAKRVDCAEDVIVIPVAELDERIDRIAQCLVGRPAEFSERVYFRRILEA